MQKPTKKKKVKKYKHHDKRLLRSRQEKVIIKAFNPFTKKSTWQEVYVLKDSVVKYEKVKTRFYSWIRKKIKTGKKDRHRTKAEKLTFFSEGVKK